MTIILTAAVAAVAAFVYLAWRTHQTITDIEWRVRHVQAGTTDLQRRVQQVQTQTGADDLTMWHSIEDILRNDRGFD